jgi:glycosyltransferase involved in cell wall biosynthesis
MKILILSSPNPQKTAGVVASDIYNGLKHIEGNEVKMLVKTWGKYKDKNIITFEPFFTSLKNSIIGRLRRGLLKYKLIKSQKNKSNPDYHVQDIDQTITYHSSQKMVKKIGFTPDVILVLFMQNFLSYKNLYEFKKITKAKIYLMLMDMASYTGGCHYAWDCKGYTNQCGTCPALYSNDPHDQSNINWEFKKKYIELTNLTIIAGAEWQVNQIRISSLYANKSVHKILGSINPNIFKPVNKEQLRLKMGIPQNKKIIFFGSVGLTNKRKGMQCLLNSLKILNEQLKGTTLENNIALLIAGNGIESIGESLNFEYYYLGMLQNSHSLASAYQMADLFVSPSIEDSGPIMVNQAIMCGTPVVAFEMGVALDLVITGYTGYRAKLGDVNDLANGIKNIINLSSDQCNTIAQNCRAHALELCNPVKQIEKLNKLFNS